MLAVVFKTFNLFIPFIIGFIVTKTRLFKRGDEQVLIRFVFYIILPATLFLSCYKVKWSIFGNSYLLGYLMVTAMTFAISIVVAKVQIKASSINGLIFSLLTTQVGVGLFTIPLFNVIFESAALAMPLMIAQSAIILTISIVLLELQSKPLVRQDITRIIVTQLIKAIWHNPVIIFSFAGLILGSLQIKLPTYFMSGIEFISQPLSMIALFCLGLGCGFNLNMTSLNQNKLLLLSQLLVKLFIFPTIALLIGKWLNLAHMQLSALVLFCASPTAAHTYVISKRYASDSEFANLAIVFSTLGAYFTTGFWIWLLH